MFRLLVVLAVSCGSPPPRRAPAAQAVPVLPDASFADLDRVQREELMKTHVLPEMTAVFTRHDPQKFADMTCETCHAETTWAMPNPTLPRLDLENLAAFDARDVEWMKTSVIPAMRRLLRDPDVRCARCHPMW